MASRVCSRVHKNTLRQVSTIPVPAVRTPSLKHLYSAPSTDVTSIYEGVRVASQTLPGETACIGVWIDSGSRYETAKNNGVAHLLERMTFKGTTSRPQQWLVEEIENIGGQVNACTSREHTVYTAKVFEKDVPRAMQIISDILQNSVLDEKAIEHEKGVILHELANNGHAERVMEYLHETAFLGTNLGQSIVGSEESIKSLSRNDLVDYIQTHHTAGRFVVAGAGAVDHNELVDLTRKYFGRLPTEPKKPVEMQPAIFTGSDKQVRFDSMPEAHIALAFETASWSSEYVFPLMLIQTILGEWDRRSPAGLNAASRLAWNMAEDEAAHSFKTFNKFYKDTGLFGVCVTTGERKVEEAMYHVTYNITRICHEVTDEEVDRAKTQMKANVLMQMGDFSSICDDIGRQMITYGRRMTTAEIVSRIDALTTDEIKTTANNFFNDEDHALAAVGPIFELPDYNWIRRRSFWNRY